jgi:aerobic carbon-monoxide dehydrogenase large subunit
LTGHFETSGAVLTGYLTAPVERQDFSGTVDGNTLKFDLAVTQPMKITLKFDLQVDDNTIFCKVKMGMYGSVKLTGQRVSTQLQHDQALVH